MTNSPFPLVRFGSGLLCRLYELLREAAKEFCECIDRRVRLFRVLVENAINSFVSKKPLIRIAPHTLYGRSASTGFQAFTEIYNT
jgi:hypothetical protein